MTPSLTDRAARHLDLLCSTADRRVGGPGNREATHLFARTAQEFGWEVSAEEFDCVDSERGPVTLEADGQAFDAHVGLYSPPCYATRPLAAADTIEALESGDFRDTILLLHGDLVREQLMPKGFVFFNPEGHSRIIEALESQQPAAIIAATGKNSGLTASLYPFPLFEDADFDIPNAYMKDVDGEDLMSHRGRDVTLRFDSRRIPRQGQHVIARKQGDRPGRVVLFGHVDTREGTPGALDNATGTVALMLLAELLADHHSGPSVELAPLNGEDYYAAPGHMLWMAENDGRFDDIVLGFNADGAGFVEQPTAVSGYGLPAELERVVSEAMALHEGFVHGDPWPQSDHSLFIQQGRPAVAVTSGNFAYLAAEIAHTPEDTLENVDPAIVAEIAEFYRDVIVRL